MFASRTLACWRWSRRALLAAALAATVPAANGCSLLVSTSGLVAPEAGSIGGGDAGDAGANSDAATNADAGSDADAAAAPFCASQAPKPKFCADFDTGALADLGDPSGTLMLDTAVAKSPERSLSCVVASGGGGAAIRRGFADTPASYDLSFDVYVDKYDPAHDVELITINLEQSPKDDCVTDVSIRGGGKWTIDESCSSNGTQTMGVSHTSNLAVQLRRWVHIDASVSFAPTRTLSLSVDGQSLFASIPLDPVLMTGKPTLIMGITYVQQAADGAKVNLDNVRFDYR